MHSLPNGHISHLTSTAKHLDPSTKKSDYPEDDEDNEEPDIPNEVERALGELFELIQDKVRICFSAFNGILTSIVSKDTSVRWSSAKGIANISERLPASFTEQVVDNILGHYSVYGVNIAPSELPPTAEHTWHGATLACAEMARRNLISDSMLPDVLRWTRKVYFSSEAPCEPG